MATTLVITGMAMTNTTYASTSKTDTSFGRLAEEIVLQYDKTQNEEQSFGADATKIVTEALDANTVKTLGYKAREFNKAITEIEKVVNNLNQHKRFSEKFQKELDNMQ